MRTIFLLCCLGVALPVVAQQDYFVKFPDDIRWTSCPPDSFDFGAPAPYAPVGVDSLQISYEDAMITVVPDACFIIERGWLVKSYPYDPMLPCIQVPNPNPVAITGDPANLPGPIVSAVGTPAPWTSTVVKLSPVNPQPTDFSTYWSATANCYQYTQSIRIVDLEAPQILNCPGSPKLVQDLTPNDELLWNAPYWTNPLNNAHDLSEAPVDLSLQAKDNCTGINLSIRYLLFLDLDGNGTYETVVNSENPPAAGQVNFNNADTPNYAGGEPRDFDERPVTAEKKYRFGLQSTVSDARRTALPGWNTAELPNVWIPAQLPAGTHKIRWIVEDGCGNQSVCEQTFTVLPSNLQVRTLSGVVLRDNNANCLADPGEAVLPGWTSKIESIDGGPNAYAQYSSPYVNGRYTYFVDSGAYRLTIVPPNEYWGDCPLDEVVEVHSVGDSSTIDFALQPVALCPFLETNIGIWGLRRCFNNTYTVQYCNTGTTSASDAYVRVTLDPYMTFVTAGLPGVQENDMDWRFNIGDIPVGHCGSFSLTVYVDCDSTMIGQALCVEAHIYPDSICLEPPWTGANVEVDGACHPDSVRFVIRNTGPAPSALLDYIVIEDNIINFQGSFQLPAGDSLPVSVPANGSTWRVEAEQQPGNPGDPMPSATIEACGQNASGGFSIGFLSQFGDYDHDPFVSRDCRELRGSYDPNDKTGFPLGFGEDHLIEPGQPLEYLIRFQNTGNDTAFRVVVVDTLPAGLDPVTLSAGAASHDYRFTLSAEGVATFTFDNILLADSFVNEPASHGFVKFRIAQQPDLPLGTVLANRAAIYFDFNTPVITPDSRHTVGKNFIPVKISEPQQPSSQGGTIWPNPARFGEQLHLSGRSLESGRLEWYDAQGRRLYSGTFTGRQLPLLPAGAGSGLYFYKIYEGEKWLLAGRIMMY